MGASREDPETGVTHDVSVAPCWGMVAAACGHMPKHRSWSETTYVYVECEACQKVIAAREEWVRSMNNYTRSGDREWDGHKY